ncbi:MAG: anthranilate synthase component I family protein [Chloroflexi bacterium]|nr:anthranilate synthase component I family protein [Chloroflexota bacterium]
MLELHGPADAFERLEAFLVDAGLLGPGADPLTDPRVADVYLGYGLSEPMRRTVVAAPPEVARLPLLACHIREPGAVAGSPAVPATPAAASSPPRGWTTGPWSPTWTAAAHRAAISAAREAIADGEIYQVNLVQHLSASFDGDPAGLAHALAPLRPLHPHPMIGDDWAIVSASPELFLSRRGELLTTMPIKGTRPAGGAADLRTSDKDAAEHVMIVDLERNDLGRVSVPGSVRWPELLAPRAMAGVEHLVSRVTGIARPGLGLADLLRGLFPGGSVTGAPKVAALDHIARLEPVGRGASMGALGTIRPGGDLDLALTIRTFAVADGRIHLWVGGGIVWDSDPGAEVEESWVKARPLLAAIGVAPRDLPLAARGTTQRPAGSTAAPTRPTEVLV